MNVYWMGTEDVDFVMTGAMTSNSQAAFTDTAWVRGNVTNLNNGNPTTWPLTLSASNPVSFGNLSSFWVHAYVAFEATGTQSNAIFLALADAAGVGRILLRGTGSAGQFKISSRNAAGTITDFTGATTATPCWSIVKNKIDVSVNYGTSGRIIVYLNGAVVADTGVVNVTTDSATSLSFLYLSGMISSSSGTYWSQVIVADVDTRSCGLWLMNSSTAGNAQTWTGTAANLNKQIISDATFVTAASAGLIEEFKTGGIALPTGTFTVAAVKMVSRGFGGSAGGPTRMEYVTRVGSTDYVGGVWTPPIGAFGNDTQNYIQATNPGTSVAWTTTDLTAATFNYGIESVA